MTRPSLSHRPSHRPPHRSVSRATRFRGPARRGRMAAARLRSGGERGMTTAEYAIGTVAACSFAALLFTILHSGAVVQALTGLITRALGMM